LIGLPIGGLRQRRHGEDLALVEAGERGIDHVLGLHLDLAGQMSGRRAGDVPELGGRGARQHRLDPDVLFLQLVLQRVRQRQHEGLAAAVDAVEQLRLHADHRGDVDDGAAAARDESRHRGIGQAHQRIDIERDHVAHLVDFGCEPRRGGADAGIVHQHADAGIVAQNGFDPRHVTALAEVGGNDLDRSACLRRETLGEPVEALAVTCDEDQIVATPCEPVRIAVA
ncbi:hypothetical protein NS44R_14700, partial [Mammaliicoccus sciuri]